MKFLVTFVLAVLAVVAIAQVKACGPKGCPNGWTQYGEQCYRLFNFECPEVCNFWAAFTKCQMYQAIPANSKTRDNDQFLQGLIDAESSQNDVMLGGFYENWYWEWSDGTRLNYTNWAPSEPEREGNMLMREEGWTGVSWKHTFGNKDAFICEKKS